MSKSGDLVSPGLFLKRRKEDVMNIRKILRKGEEAQIKKRQIRYYAFWGLMIYVAIGTTVYILFHTGVIGKQDTSSSHVVEAKSKIDTVSAKHFAEQFAKEDFTWTGDPEERAKNLSKYLAQGVDPQAGVQNTGQTRSFGTSASVADVIEKDEKTATFIVFVQSQFEIPDQKNPKDVKRYMVSRYLSIPVATDGKGGYAVISNPRIVTPPKKANIKSPEIPKGEEVEKTISDSITAFLINQFFPTYTDGTPQDISYLFLNGKRVAGYEGLMSFERLENIVVYKENDNSYRTECNVQLRDNGTDILYSVPFTLFLEQKGSQWLVQSIESR